MENITLNMTEIWNRAYSTVILWSCFTSRVVLAPMVLCKCGLRWWKHWLLSLWTMSNIVWGKFTYCHGSCSCWVSLTSSSVPWWGAVMWLMFSCFRPTHSQHTVIHFKSLILPLGAYILSLVPCSAMNMYHTKPYILKKQFSFKQSLQETGTAVFQAFYIAPSYFLAVITFQTLTIQQPVITLTPRFVILTKCWVLQAKCDQVKQFSVGLLVVGKPQQALLQVMETKHLWFLYLSHFTVDNFHMWCSVYSSWLDDITRVILK